MNGEPTLHYKPGLTLDAPISVTVAAADWLILMNWFNDREDDGAVRHIVYGVMAGQIQKALYTQESIKSAKALVAERIEQHPLNQIFQQMTGGGIPSPEQFGEEE